MSEQKTYSLEGLKSGRTPAPTKERMFTQARATAHKWMKGETLAPEESRHLLRWLHGHMDAYVEVCAAQDVPVGP